MLVPMQNKNPFNGLLTIQVKEAFCKVEENACVFLRVDIFIVEDSCLLTLRWA